MLIHSIFLSIIISFSCSYCNKIKVEKSIIAHFIDITILSIVFYLITAYYTNNILTIFLGYILFIYYLNYLRFKIFLLLSKKTQITDLEKIYNESFNQHLNIYSINFFKQYKFYFDKDFVYINESLLKLEKKELIFLLNFFKKMNSKEKLIITLSSIIPFILFFLSNIYIDSKDFLNAMGGISIFIILNFEKYFIGFYKVKKINIKDKTNLIESLNSYKKLIQKDKYNATNTFKIQKIINEINNI